MQGNNNRSFSNPPLRELNSINVSQKINTTLNSTLEASKINPVRANKEVDVFFENPSKIRGLEGDRPALIYRINKLQQEVDTLNKENSDLHSKLHSEKARFEEVQKKIVHSSKVKNLVDKNYLGDLRYEREENVRLKHLLHSLEVERNELRNKVRELDAVHCSGVHEKQEVMGRLQQKIDHVSIVEGDNRILVDKISLMHNKLMSFEKENLQIANENEKMKSLLGNLEIENREILNTVQEECKKYNNFVNAKNDELANVKWAFKRQLKVVSARNLYIALSKAEEIRKITGFLKLANFIEARTKYNWVLRRISSVFAHYNQKSLQNGFSSFKKLVSWTATSKVSQNFISKLRHKHFMGRVLNGWKRVVADDLKKFGKKTKSTKKLIKFLHFQMKNSLESRINHWKLVVLHSGSQRKVMQKLIKNHKSSSLSQRFLFWKQKTQILKNLQNIENLSVDFAGTIVKIKYFLAFREFVRVKKCRKEEKIVKNHQAGLLRKMNLVNEMNRFSFKQRSKVDKLKGVLFRIQQKDLNAYLQKWKFEVNSWKASVKYDSVVGYLNVKQTEKFLQTVFLAWKNSLIKGKLIYTQEVLAVERPQRQGLELSLAALTESHNVILQKSALKMLLNPMYRKLKLSFMHWRGVGTHFKGFLHNVRYLIIKHYRLNLLKGFKAWKEKTFQKSFEALSYKNNQNVLEKIELNQQLLTLTDQLRAKEANLAYLKETRMKRCLAYMQNRDLANALQLWLHKSRILSSKLLSANSLLKTFTRLVFRISFKSISTKAKENKEKFLRARKFQKFVMIKCLDSVNLTFDSWKKYTGTMKNFRKVVSATYARKVMSNKEHAWTLWQEFINGDKFGKLQYQHLKLTEYKEQLECEVEKITELLGESRSSNERFDQILRNKGKQRVTIALIKGCTDKVRKSWGKWKTQLSKFKTLQKKTEKIIRCWANQELRQAWHTWVLFLKEKFKKTTAQLIEKQKKDMSSFRMETKKTKQLLEQEIEEKTNQLQSLSINLEKKNKFTEYLLDKSIQNLNNNYCISRAGYYFSIMKQRYLDRKKSLKRFAKTLRLVNVRRGMKDIKAYCLETIKINSLKNMLVGVFKRFGVRFLRFEFDRWTRNTWQVSETKLKNKLKAESSKAQAAANKENLIKMKNREKFLRLLLNQNKENMFQMWKQVTSGIKKRRIAQKLLQKKIIQLKFRFLISNLAENVLQNKQTRLKALKSMNMSSSNLIKLVFSEWKLLHATSKSFTKALSHLKSRYSSILLTHSFHKLQNFSQQQKFLSLSKASKKFALVKKVLASKFFKSLQFFFQFWRAMKNFRKGSAKVLRGSLLKAFHRKIRSAFDMWSEDVLLKETVEITNSQGPVAIENGILRGRIEILNKLISEEGLDPRHVEKYILEKETQHSALTLQSIHLSKYKSGLINPKDRTTLPKFFLIWKQWLLKRKKIQKMASRLLCYTRKPDLLHGFLKWKHGLSLIINTVSKLTRRNLFSLIAKMDMDVKFLESKLESTHKSLLYFETYSNLLTSQVRRGQNMALLACGLQQHKSMLQVFNRWAYYTSLCKIQEFLEQLTSAEQSLYIVKTTLKSMEEDNLVLVEENYELRQASLDGVAIAEAFETLSKERERLSMDLAERTATIKKLIDHNNELADRLRNAGFEDVSEREVLKSKRYL